MKRPNKEIRIQMLEARLAQYEQQHESLEHDVIAATATGAEDAAEAVEGLKGQQDALSKAHAAIKKQLDAEKSKPERSEKKSVPKKRKKK